MRAFLFALLLTIASAHVCLVQPLQRGGATGLNKAASPDCGLTTGPCGGRATQRPKVVLESGGRYTIIFQKNLDHYSSNATGHFVISYEKVGQHGSFRQLAKIPDTDTPSLTLFPVNVILPDHEYKHAIISVQYVAPSINHVFYQCADIELKRFN